jgi:hypothetical protein
MLIELPEIPLAYDIPGVGLGFLNEVDLLSWLHQLLVSSLKLTVDDALGRLRCLSSSTTVEAEVYAFFLGLNGLEFGEQVTFDDFVIGKAIGENDLVDGKRMQFKCSAMDFFIKTRASLPIKFGSGVVDFDFRPHPVKSFILDPLAAELQLLEAERRSPVRPFAFHLRFDLLSVPLARSFDYMSELGSGSSGRRPGASVNGKAVGQLWNKYARLSGSGKEQIKTSLRWISKSLHMDESVDAMIAVGTALEVLFLDRGIQDQLTYRISLNGSLWLEDSSANRLLVQKRSTRLIRRDPNQCMAVPAMSILAQSTKVETSQSELCFWH